MLNLFFTGDLLKFTTAAAFIDITYLGISLLFLHLYVEKRNPEYLKKAGLLLEGSLHRLAGKKVVVYSREDLFVC